MSFSIALGNFLYKNAFPLYKPLYAAFKKKQDAFEIRLLKNQVKPGDNVIDIGANIGFYAKLLSDLVGPHGRVHCFEPDEQNFKHLKTSLRSRHNILVNNQAVAAESGPITIYTSKNLNVDHRTYKPDDYDKEILSHAISLDDYVKFKVQTEAKKISLIKIDIQGFEMQAMHGMEKTLNENPGVKIISEFWPYGLSKAGSSAMLYFEFLKNRGFKCFLIENDSLTPLDTEKVKSIENLGEEHYFNILASRFDV